MGYYFIREPKYFREFTCTGSECESNCCRGWEDLIWLNEEYERLCSLDLPDEMRERVKSAFVRLDIPELDEPLWNLRLSGKKCPFLAENRLCSIQRKFGEDFISNTCRVYPRVSVFNSATMTRGCYASCPEVAKALLNDEFALEICTRQVQVSGNEIVLKSVLCEGEEDFLENPALRYRNELFGLYYDILASRKRPLEENMILGAEIAKRISGVENAEEIPAEIERQKSWFNAPDIVPKCNIFERAAELFTEIFGDKSAISAVLTNGKIDNDKLSAELFPRHFFGNIALNLLFELKMPFYFEDRSILENYSYLLAVYSLAKLTVSAAAIERGMQFALERLSELDRAIVHDKSTGKKILAAISQ